MFNQPFLAQAGNYRMPLLPENELQWFSCLKNITTAHLLQARLGLNLGLVDWKALLGGEKIIIDVEKGCLFIFEVYDKTFQV